MPTLSEITSYFLKTCLAALKGAAWLLFAVYPGREVDYGELQAFEPLTGLLTLVIAIAASYALAVNQLPDSERVASYFYVLISLVTVVLIGLVINSQRKSNAPDGSKVLLKFDTNSVWYARLIAAVCIVLAFSFVSFADKGWFPGQSPQVKEYTGALVACPRQDLMSLHETPLNVRVAYRDPSTEDIEILETLKKWIKPELTRGKEDILIVEQDPAFDADYGTFSAVMHFEPTGTEFVDALVLLRRRLRGAGGESVKYRILGWRTEEKARLIYDSQLEQLRLPRDQAGQAYPVITIPKPRKDDALLIFVHFRAKEGSKLGDQPSWFNFQLRRVQRED
jgi:hypothetical protein